MNGAAFRAKCEELFPKSPPDTYSVVFLNIKNFKLLNTRFGRELCDQLLRKVMEVLQTNAGTDGFAARAEADTFYLCLKAVSYTHLDVYKRQPHSSSLARVSASVPFV